MKTFKQFINEGKKQKDDFMDDYYASTSEHPFDHRSRIHNNAATLELSRVGSRVRMHDVRALAPGGGKDAIEHVKRLADKHGVEIEGTAKAYTKSKQYPMSTKQLADYYKRRGFSVSHGSATDGYNIRYIPKKK